MKKSVFDRIQSYTQSKLKFSFFSDLFGLVQYLILIRFGLTSKFWLFSGRIKSQIPLIFNNQINNVIFQSIIYIFVNQIISTILGLPFSYYYNFILEKKYGFNKLTIKLWITDKIKTFLLLIFLGTPVIWGFLYIIDYFGNKFMFYAMGFAFLIQIIAMTILPNLILPLFNKFNLLEEGELKTKIEEFAKKQKFPLKKLYVIDGSKRSAHSNAYFTGLPYNKQIVLFDTLLKQTTIDETVAVLAHEIGHYKLSHIPKALLISQVHLFISFYFFSAFINNNSLYNSFDFFNEKPIIIGFMIFNMIFQPIECVLQFIMNLISRKNEYDADAYAKRCGLGKDLNESLIKLLIENLSPIDADWLYSSYHNSHPLLIERLKALDYDFDEVKTSAIYKND